MPVKVLLVRQDRLMFEGLVSILADRPNLEVLGVASSASDAVEKAALLQPDVVVMDVGLSDSEGWQACEHIRRRLPDIAVLFLSADVSDDAMERAVAAGAAGYLSTEVSTDEVVEAIARLAEGELLVTAAALGRLMRQGREDAGPAAASVPLNDAERAVLTRMAAGLHNWEIAEQLGLQPSAVRGRVRSLLEKLGVHSRAQAVDSARRAGLIGEAAGAAS
ncbi:MAG TPA: response regulator transcription factor [Candidatus Dormibacteraeota bacterium]|nr:response regulator transcription factor [Candidatus Dormibacteraeota bacterium]